VDERITVAHLLSHTSGIVSETKETEFVPGEKMNCSNYEYILLGQLVEKASGNSFGKYLKDTFFSPLGTNQTDYFVVNAGNDESSKFRVQNSKFKEHFR